MSKLVSKASGVSRRPTKRNKFNGSINDGRPSQTSFTTQEHEEQFETEETESKQEGSPDNTDDPVRMYLMQMGEIPMLNRAEEIASAKAIERSRFLYRHSMLATDYVLQGAVELLEKVFLSFMEVT